jgi:galactokinase
MQKVNKSAIFRSKDTHLEDIYFGSQEHFEDVHMPRYEEITKRFLKIYQEKPVYYARCPGSITLFGDYGYYHGLCSIKSAIENDIIIAFCLTSEDKIILNHALPSLFPTETISSDPNQKFQDDNNLVNYFLVGYKAALADLKYDNYPGCKLLIYGNLPTSSGLSSSYSLSVAAGLTALCLNGLLNKINSETFLENLIKFHRMVSEGSTLNINFESLLTNEKGKLSSF